MAYAAAMSTSEPEADRPKTTRPVRKRDRASAAPALRLTLRLDVGGCATLGPGKARLLELIGETGSISAAGRAMGMSYRRAWTLVESLNASFTRATASSEKPARVSPIAFTPTTWARSPWTMQ